MKQAKNIKPLRVLITAGPTKEYLDPVRYISNDSSGQMGFALARAAVHLGYAATLITGPVNLDTPEDVARIDVVSARQMRDKVMKHAKSSDIIIMAAAVADFTPSRSSKHKIKKGTGGLTLSLKKTPDILAELCKKKLDGQTIVGFALETKDLEKNARKKLKKKGCDWIVANSARTIGAELCKATLIERDGKKIVLPRLPKEDLAIIIMSHIL